MVNLIPHSIARVFLLDFGTFDVGPGRRTIGIPGFLLETDLGAHILIDTGFPPAYASGPQAALRDNLASFGHLVGFTAENTARGQLAVLGLTPADIDLVILTHSHIDHVGSLPLFTCPIAMTAQERAEPQPLYFGSARPMDWPDLPYLLIEGETALCQGLTLIPSPGHTPGHLSVLLTLPQAIILTGDAINRATEIVEGFPDAMDVETSITSAARLFTLQFDHRAEMIFGHDPAQWARLPKAPKALFLI